MTAHAPTSVLAYKCRAGLVSLAVYLVFAAVLAALVCYAWFPGYLFWLDGGLQGLRLVLAVALVLGPVMACIVVHPGKSRGKLAFDVAVIAVLQVGSMAWGLWQVREQRPVAVVYGSNRFISVAPAIMARQQETPATLQRFSPQRPPWVYRREPQTAEEKRRMVGMLFSAGFHPEAQVWLFQPFESSLGQVFERQAPIRAFVQQHLLAEWEHWLQGRPGGSVEQYRLAFFEGRFGNALLVFAPDGRLEGFLDLGQRPLPADVVDPSPAAVSR